MSRCLGNGANNSPKASVDLLRAAKGRYLHPLIYGPGTSWLYDPFIDWAGLLVERIIRFKTFEDYMVQHIWEPLGIIDMTFFLSTRPDLRTRMSSMSIRNHPGSSDDPTAQPSAVYATEQIATQPDMDDAQGGAGIFTSHLILPLPTPHICHQRNSSAD
ncbi:hypothetical protein MMC14_000453 [Varicellaria rhodocarpa]|nr:hypothetical protein [Varicellaria rhodocarpa]